ncbi:MAG: hypothetical protein ACI959_000319 [Limisphaerales bacterium]|jgi:hypothetical protein
MKLFEAIDDTLKSWIEAQHMFFVATAPLTASGHVNVSPKGLNTFRILDQHTVAYLDLTGSGVETIAHLKENKRITFMFCSFDLKPRIIRLYGKGISHTYKSVEFEKLGKYFPELPGKRAIIVAKIHRIADSCGYAVPKYELISERDTLTKSALKHGEDGLERGRKERNSLSIDGLPGLDL